MPPPSKKRRIMSLPKTLGPRPEEISFDLSARQDYLTGFHKRKVERTKAAQEAAERRIKEEKRQQRQKLRNERKLELEERVQMVDAYFKPTPAASLKEGDDTDASEDEAVLDEESPPERVDHEAEYIDEDKYTSVVVEEVGVDRDGFVFEANEESTGPEPDTDGVHKSSDSTEANKKRTWTAEKPKGESKPKKKRKKFRYENKAERKVERQKQRDKNSRQAKARRAK
jgi:ribosomal RNA-processing protein 17